MYLLLLLAICCGTLLIVSRHIIALSGVKGGLSGNKKYCGKCYYVIMPNSISFHMESLVWARLHYNDVIMSAMASQITSLTIVYSTIYSRSRSKKPSKLRVTGLCEGNSPVTGEFPAKKARTAEHVWWRHNVQCVFNNYIKHRVTRA